MSKTIIHCPCGAKVSLGHAEPGQKYRCPNCKKPIIATGSSKPAHAIDSPKVAPAKSPSGGMRNFGGTPQHDQHRGQSPGGMYAASMAPPQPTNGLALTGFVLSLVSFVFILLAPVAFIVSIMGLRKPNSGLGVAGAVISALQTCVLVAFGIMFFGLGWLTWTVAREATDSIREVAEDVEVYTRTELTRDTIGQAGEDIDKTALATHELPGLDDGNALIKHYKDAWGNPLRYEHDDNALASYSIISPGPDGVAETLDDVGMSRPSCAPSSVAESIALLSATSKTQRQAGLNWAVSNSPNESNAADADRQVMVDQLVLLLADSGFGDDVTRAIERWLDEEAIDSFSSRISTASAVPPIRTLELLIDLEQDELVLEMLNHSDPAVRSRVDRFVRDHKIPNQSVIEQCVQDVEDPSLAEQAIARLQTTELDAAEKQELVDRMVDGLLRSTIGLRFFDETVALISSLGADQDLIPRWIEIFDKTQHREIRSILSDSHDQRVIEHYAAKLGTPGRVSGEARILLQEMGPVAEDAILAKLKSAAQPGSLRSFLIDTLEVIGTEKSIPHLETLLDDRFVGDNAADAIRAIEQRANN